MEGLGLERFCEKALMFDLYVKRTTLGSLLHPHGLMGIRNQRPQILPQKKEVFLPEADTDIFMLFSDNWTYQLSKQNTKIQKPK